MICEKCGSENSDQAGFCRSCGQALNATTRSAGQGNATAGVTTDEYAGFWVRFAALIIDSILLVLISIPVFVVFGIVVALMAGGSNISNSGSMVIALLIYPLIFAISAAYFVLMESGEKGATFGKRLLKIRVLDLQGNRISKGRALGRWASHLLSNFTLYIGYFIQPFTAKKQALHDMVAGTIIVRTEKDSSSAVVVIVAVVAFFFVIVVGGILAAIAIPAYQDYVTKAKVYQAVSIGEAATTAFSVYYMDTGKIPSSLEQMKANVQKDPDISDISISPENGEITITFRQGLSAGISGKHISMMPSQSGGQISWKCGSDDIKASYLPQQCR